MSRGSRVLGTSTMTVKVNGIGPIRRALRPLLEPELTKHLDAANRAAARSLAKDLRKEVKPISKHMAKAVRVKRARTGKPGWVVGSRRKVAFFWHMVIGGTRSHGPRKAPALVFVPGWNPYLGASSKGAGNRVVRVKRVRGVKGNDAVGRVARGQGRAALKRIEQQIVKEARL